MRVLDLRGVFLLNLSIGKSDARTSSVAVKRIGMPRHDRLACGRQTCGKTKMNQGKVSENYPLARYFPERFALRDSRFSSLQEGLEWRLSDIEPLDLLGSVLQEDVCIMHERLTEGGAEHLFVAGVVMDSFDPVAKHMEAVE
eukprot:s3059_g5.t1